MNEELSQEDIRALLIYDPLTGEMKFVRAKRAKPDHPANYLHQNGYQRVWIRDTAHMAHKLAWIYSNGAIPEGMFVDHKNGDPTDNRLENLRLATMTQNNMNRRIQKNNKTGYKGVSRSSKSLKWRANIGLNKKRIHLGIFDTPEEAAHAYNKAAIIVYGEFACLNPF